VAAVDPWLLLRLVMVTAQTVLLLLLLLRLTVPGLCVVRT